MTSSEFDKQLQHRYKVIAAVVRKIISDVDIENFDRTRKKVAEKLLDKALVSANVEVSDFASQAVKRIYNEKKQKTAQILKRKKYKKARDEKGHNKRVFNLIFNMSKILIGINNNLKKTALTYLSLVEKASGYLKKAKVQEFNSGEFDDDIEEIVWKGVQPVKRLTKAGYEYVAGKSLGEIKQDIRRHFEKVFGKFDVIIIGERAYNLNSYLELIARTQLIDVYTQSTLETCKQYGDDLVQFSHHDEPCEICADLEGQIFSISGDSEKFPQLTDDETPPVHPNCEHNLNPVSLFEARV